MNYKNLFYFDIETVGQYRNLYEFEEADKRGYELFVKKHKRYWILQEATASPAAAYIRYAPTISTYGKIVCISFGYFHDKNDRGYTVNSIYGDDEELIIKEFAELLEKVSRKHMYLSGYNINSFDIPWVVHKMSKYGVDVPVIMRVYGKKPWEVPSVDLFDYWKLSYRLFYSFDEVCYELGVKSPKDIIDGSEVHNVYWETKDLEMIKTYCEKDVFHSMEVAKKMLTYEV